jgi:hypothetical protein
MIIMADRHAAHATYTQQDKQTLFSTQNKDKVSRTTKMSRNWIQIMTYQWLITYQTNVLTTWFLKLFIDECIDNKKYKV